MEDKTKGPLTDIELLEACRSYSDFEAGSARIMEANEAKNVQELCNRYQKACIQPALGNATTDQLISEMYARFDSFENLRAIPFTAILEDLRNKLTQQELQYKTNDEPLTARSIPKRVDEKKMFYWFPNHGDEDGRRSYTIAYGNPENEEEADTDFIITGAEDDQDDATEACKRLNEILNSYK